MQQPFQSPHSNYKTRILLILQEVGKIALICDGISRYSDMPVY
jgi:hypothetical protein